MLPLLNQIITVNAQSAVAQTTAPVQFIGDLPYVVQIFLNQLFLRLCIPLLGQYAKLLICL